MTQEDKDLLINDLCARLPYGVKAQHQNPAKLYDDMNIIGYCDSGLFIDDNGGYYDEQDIKPYLFPLSSMTEEQRHEFNSLNFTAFIDKYGCIDCINEFGNIIYSDIDDWLACIDWLNEHHYDFRGLLDKGLAIDATGLNIY